MHILIADILKSPTGIGQITNPYWQKRQLVLTKSPTGIGQIANRYWRIWQNIHINYAYSYCRHSEIAYRYWWNHLPVFAKSPTGIGQIANRYLPNRQPVLMKLYTKKTSWQFGQSVGDFVNTCWRFGQYGLAIWPIPVSDFVNTGEGTFSKIWAGLRSVMTCCSKTT